MDPQRTPPPATRVHLALSANMIGPPLGAGQPGRQVNIKKMMAGKPHPQMHKRRTENAMVGHDEKL